MTLASGAVAAQRRLGTFLGGSGGCFLGLGVCKAADGRS